MILPTKGIAPERALLTIGGEIIDLLESPRTVSSLWHELIATREREARPRIRYDWFVLALDMLFALGAITLGNDNLLRASTP